MDGRKALGLLGLVVAALLASGVAPVDRATWWLEVAPVLIGVAIVVPSWRRFPLTPLLAGLLALHAGILVLGGHYTYAQALLAPPHDRQLSRIAA